MGADNSKPSVSSRESDCRLGAAKGSAKDPTDLSERNPTEALGNHSGGH